MTKREKELLAVFYAELEETKIATQAVPVETYSQKQTRIKKLLGDHVEFVKYYFKHHIDSELGYFQLEMLEEVINDPTIYFIGEWPREHAKSTFAGIFIPMYLIAKGELTGMILASQTADRAISLLLSLKKELMGNQLFINDFGDITEGQPSKLNEFIIKGNIGFLAVGLGQSARGYKVANNRPNYILGDDLDTLKLVLNLERVMQVVDWFMEDVYPAASITGARTVVVGNRIHRASVLAHLVGDISPKHPKNEGIYHSKVYATEDPVTKEMLPIETGTPAWKERYTVEMLINRWKPMKKSSILREYYHQHVVVGLIFLSKWILWGKMLPIKSYEFIVVYGDPSFTNNKKSDYKAIVAVAKTKRHYHVLKAWVRIASILSMVKAYYNFYSLFGDNAEYWIEANATQKDHLKHFEAHAEQVGYRIPIRADTTPKDNKFTRIENMSPDFENGFFLFNEQENEDPDMKEGIDQILTFGGSGKDDFPDALQGAYAKIRKKITSAKIRPILGTYKRQRR